jgi:hypothetical protein
LDSINLISILRIFSELFDLDKKEGFADPAGLIDMVDAAGAPYVIPRSKNPRRNPGF